MTEFNTTDVVKSALAGNATQVKYAVHGILASKVSDALDVKRATIAASWLQEPTDEDENG